MASVVGNASLLFCNTDCAAVAHGSEMINAAHALNVISSASVKNHLVPALYMCNASANNCARLAQSIDVHHLQWKSTLKLSDKGNRSWWLQIPYGVGVTRVFYPMSADIDPPHSLKTFWHCWHWPCKACISAKLSNPHQRLVQQLVRALLVMLILESLNHARVANARSPRCPSFKLTNVNTVCRKKKRIMRATNETNQRLAQHINELLLLFCGRSQRPNVCMPPMRGVPSHLGRACITPLLVQLCACWQRVQYPRLTRYPCISNGNPAPGPMRFVATVRLDHVAME